ncbi:MAG TPA: DUF2141 domain-containing protein [Sphingobium sp.]|uniref:DUF2141 domain-containing protein n=1 Tax=Sphingobium sp. TaxID=1912891 RepID=UPI002ED53912
MKRFFLPLSLLVAALPSAAFAQECAGTKTASTVKLTVEATGLRNAQGEIAFTVYNDDPKRFMAPKGKLLRVRVPAVAPMTHACFWLPPGRYATTQYHDEDGDRHFGRTLFSPKEGFGFSNDAPTTLGLPSLKSALFTLPPEGRTVRMATRYKR